MMTATSGGIAQGSLRVGAMDVGSNALRLLVADVGPGGRLEEVVVQDRAPVRLGHEVFLTGRMTADSMAAAVEALGRFREAAAAAGVELLRAVATSAVREAANGREFLDRVRTEAGVELETISGAEEARLVHLAVASRIPLEGARWILADLGGGSVEVSMVDARGILWSESHTIGSVRLMEELAQAGAEPGRYARLLEEYVAALRLPGAAGARRAAGFIATGGNMEVLARLAGPVRPGVPATVPLARLRAVIESLARLSYRQRVTELGLREDRADVILPAAVIYERLCRLAGREEILVPFVGLKEGIVLDLAARHRGAPGEDVPLEEELADALVLGRRFGFEEEHGLQVARLADMLHRQLAPGLGLDPGDRRLLLTAALLHDVGQFISYKAHHKHSLYLLSASELPGFSPAEMQVIANVARYHRKRHPSPDHPAWAALPPGDRERVRRLAALLRLADALDREHAARVRSIRATLTGDALLLEIAGGGDLLLETWALKRKAGLFSEVFGRKVEVVA